MDNNEMNFITIPVIQFENLLGASVLLSIIRQNVESMIKAGETDYSVKDTMFAILLGMSYDSFKASLKKEGE